VHYVHVYIHVCVCVSGRGGALACHVYVLHLLSLMTDKFIKRIDVNIICLKLEEICCTTRVQQLIELFLHNIVGVMTRVWPGHLRNYGLIPSRGEIFISSLKNPNHLWGLTGLVLNG